MVFYRKSKLLIFVFVFLHLLCVILNYDYDSYTISNLNILQSLRYNYICNSDLKVNNSYYDIYNTHKSNNKQMINPIYLNCNGNGECNSDKTDCLCFKGYITYFQNIIEYKTSNQRCNYTLKYQSTALILAIILPFGFLHFYIGNIFIGVVQLLYFSTTIVLSTYSFFIVSTKSEYWSVRSLSLFIISCVFSFFSFSWYILDIILVSTNTYLDKSGNELI